MSGCRLDYVGIVMAITGSLMPWLYYGYHCRLETQATHVALSLSLGVVCLVYIAVMFDEFILQRCVKAGTSSKNSLNRRGQRMQWAPPIRPVCTKISEMLHFNPLKDKTVKCYNILPSKSNLHF